VQKYNTASGLNPDFITHLCHVIVEHKSRNVPGKNTIKTSYKIVHLVHVLYVGSSEAIVFSVEQTDIEAVGL